MRKIFSIILVISLFICNIGCTENLSIDDCYETYTSSDYDDNIGQIDLIFILSKNEESTLTYYFKNIKSKKVLYFKTKIYDNLTFSLEERNNDNSYSFYCYVNIIKIFSKVFFTLEDYTFIKK